MFKASLKQQRFPAHQVLVYMWACAYGYVCFRKKTERKKIPHNSYNELVDTRWTTINPKTMTKAAWSRFQLFLKKHLKLRCKASYTSTKQGSYLKTSAYWYWSKQSQKINVKASSWKKIPLSVSINIRWCSNEESWVSKYCQEDIKHIATYPYLISLSIMFCCGCDCGNGRALGWCYKREEWGSGDFSLCSN